MSGQATGGRTSEIEMVASRVVQNQAKYCTMVMDNIQKQLDALVEEVRTIRETVTANDRSIIALKGRVTLYTIVTAVVGFIVAIVSLIRLLD